MEMILVIVKYFKDYSEIFSNFILDRKKYEGLRSLHFDGNFTLKETSAKLNLTFTWLKLRKLGKLLPWKISVHEIIVLQCLI